MKLLKLNIPVQATTNEPTGPAVSPKPLQNYLKEGDDGQEENSLQQLQTNARR
jgi:hypothetical protein